MDPIVIVGAGPVGLSLALGLLRRGVEVVVVDQRPGIPQDPRATTVQPPVLEAYESWGVLPTLLERGRVVTHLQYWDWTTRQCLADLDFDSLEGDTSCPFRVHLDQAGICEVLLGAIEATAPGTVRWGEKATGLHVHDDHVQLITTTRSGQVGVHRGRWICGADGGKSWVRQQLDIAWEGPSHQESFLTAQLDPSAFHALAERAGGPLAGVSYLFLKDDWAMVMELPHIVRVLFHVGGDASEELDRKATKARAWALLGADEHHLKSTGQYNVRLRLASQLVKGRAVLLGDAAHAGYPVGGTAMNAGILDAVSLAEALANHNVDAVEAYGETRRRWNRHHLLGETARELNAMEAHWPWTRLYRNRTLGKLHGAPAARLAHLLQLSLMADHIA